MSDRHKRPERPRTSMVDRAWDEVPSAIPDDTMLDPTVDSKELTSPDPSRRPNELMGSQPQGGASALGLPPASRTPVPATAEAGPSHASPVSSRAGHHSAPPPPPSGRASVPPAQPSRPSAPPPPSRRASVRPARPSAPPPAPRRVSHPPPPPIDTVTASLGQLVAAPDAPPPPSAAAPPPPSADAPPPPSAAAPPPPTAFAPPPSAVAPVLPVAAPIGPSSLAPTQPSPAAGVGFFADAAPPSGADVRSVDQLPTLPDALRQRVRVGQGAGPLWGFALIAVALSLGAMAVFSGSCSALLARSSNSAPVTTSSAATSASAPSSPEPVQPAPAPTPSANPANDKAALAAIAARSPRERSVADVLTASAARGSDKRSGVRDDAARASQNPLFAGSPELSAKLRAAAADPDTMHDALGAMATLPSPAGPDLLYYFWSTRKKQDPSAELADALLQTKEVRDRASPELSALLDLRAAESCDDVKAALASVEARADRRVISLLSRFGQKRGCGDRKRDDCFPCLREGDELKNATKSAIKRAPPKL